MPTPNNNCGYDAAGYILEHLATAKENPVELKERNLDFYSNGTYVAFN